MQSDFETEVPDGAGESSPPTAVSAEDVMYVEGMAPRVDKLERSIANNSPRHQYIVMRAYARGLEIKLRKLLKRPSEASPSSGLWHVIFPDIDTGETACALLGRDGVLHQVAAILDESPGVVITIVPRMYGAAHLNGKPV